MQIIDNFEYSGTKELDRRKIWNSLNELQSNTTILMPYGFEVYCKEENTKYKMTCTNENDPTTYVFTPYTSNENSLRFPYKKNAGITIGSIDKGTNLYNEKLLDIVAAMLKVYVKPSINVESTPTSLIRGYDDIIRKEDGVTLKIFLNNHSETIANGTTFIEVYRDSATTPFATVNYVTGQNVYEVKDNSSDIISDTVYKIKASLPSKGSTIIQTAGVSYRFVPCYYWGACPSNNPDNLDLTKANKLIRDSSNDKYIKTYYTASNEYCYFLSPVELTKILDQNSFDNTSSFNKTTKTITFSNGQTMTYYFYMTDYPLGCNNFGYKFYVK